MRKIVIPFLIFTVMILCISGYQNNEVMAAGPATPTDAQLKAKAQAIVETIFQFSDEERRKQPTIPFGQDYSNLVKIVGQVHPELSSLLPPTVEYADYPNPNIPGAKIKLTSTPYLEIATYCREIVGMLSQGQPTTGQSSTK